MVIPTDKMEITRDTSFQPGVYYLPNGISISADGITLDGNGVVLFGHNRSGHGLTILNHNGVTVKNLRLQEYYHGIYCQGCRGLTIRDCRVTSTAEIPANSIFLDIWLPLDQAYGGGILLADVEDSQIAGNDIQHQMVGLLSYHCRRLSVNSNLSNYCSGFGFHLYDTHDSSYADNSADYCCRYQPRSPRQGHLGADAAGFLIVYNSCNNSFQRNLARMGGDGFFLAGLTPTFSPVPCNNNLFEENDGSYSPNIAFEATFSSGNIYRKNYAHHCNYGFWLGFSRDGIVENNQLIANIRAGIATENGFNFQVRGNTFSDNDHGVLLWSHYVPEFARSAPENDTSRDWTIENNTFTHNNKAVRIAANQDHGLHPLELPAELDPNACPRPHDHTLRSNQFHRNRVGIETIQSDRTIIEENDFKDNFESDLVEVP